MPKGRKRRGSLAQSQSIYEEQRLAQAARDSLLGNELEEPPFRRSTEEPIESTGTRLSGMADRAGHAADKASVVAESIYRPMQKAVQATTFSLPTQLDQITWNFQEGKIDNPQEKKISNAAAAGTRLLTRPFSTFVGEEVATSLADSAGEAMAGRLGRAIGQGAATAAQSAVDRTEKGKLSIFADPWKKAIEQNNSNINKIGLRLAKIEKGLTEAFRKIPGGINFNRKYINDLRLIGDGEDSWDAREGEFSSSEQMDLVRNLLSGEDPDYDFSKEPFSDFFDHAMRPPDTLHTAAGGSSDATQPVDIPVAEERLEGDTYGGYFPASAGGSFPGTTPPGDPPPAKAGAAEGAVVGDARGGGYSKKSLRKKRTKRTQNKTKKKRTKKKRTKKKRTKKKRTKRTKKQKKKI